MSTSSRWSTSAGRRRSILLALGLDDLDGPPFSHMLDELQRMLDAEVVQDARCLDGIAGDVNPLGIVRLDLEAETFAHVDPGGGEQDHTGPTLLSRVRLPFTRRQASREARGRTGC